MVRVDSRHGRSPGGRRRRAGLRLRAVAYAVLSAALALAAPAAAQQPGGKATEPGQIEKRIQAPEPPRKPVDKVTPPKPAAPAVGASAAKFILVGVEIAGATVYRPVELSFAYEGFLGREISLTEVGTILGRITERYRRDGYILSRAVAPPQTVARGVLRVKIIEGFIERVAFTGAKPGARALLRSFAGRITASRPMRLAELERYILLMADAPGLRVTPALKALDEARGAYHLDVALRHDPVDGFVNLDNRGTTLVGPLQAFAGVNLNSVLGRLERTRLSLFTIPNAPEELLYGEIFHEHILNAEGTRAWLSASRSAVDTGIAGDRSKENSFGTRVTLGLSHPVIRSRELNLTGTLKFSTLDSDKNSPSFVFDDRLRVVRLGARLNFTDDLGGTSWINAELSKGLDILHASDENAKLVSRAGGQSDFFKLKLDVTRRQKIVRNWSLQLAASAQKSPHILLSSEAFTVGGRRFGRAYDPSDISGGDGAAGSVELRFNAPFRPKPLRSLQLYAYYDIGAVWGEEVTHQSMASAGGGLRVGLPFKVRADVEFAVPLTRPVTLGESGNRGARVFFNILKRF